MPRNQKSQSIPNNGRWMSVVVLSIITEQQEVLIIERISRR